jgi:FMN phosphatase YigB (HAD superfamily)
MVATSDDWGVTKPDVAFFEHVVDAAPCSAKEILYVGDRLENDIIPAAEVGIVTALIRRGPWGHINEHDPEADRVATVRIRSLSELPEKVALLNAAAS